MAKNNPFREKNSGLKSKKGIKNYAWLSSALILLITGIVLIVTKNIQFAFAGVCVLCLDLAGVAGVFYKNTKNQKTLALMIFLIAAACICLFESVYGIMPL